MNENSTEGRMMLTKATMSILDSWKLDSEQMRIVLDLPEKTRGRSFQRFRSHEAFPDSEQTDRRADYLLKIAGALRTTYPTNPTMGSRWLRTRHRRFGCSPLAKMLDEGESGLVAVLAELDCTFGWDITSGKKVS
jgi:hypothetical protein